MAWAVYIYKEKTYDEFNIIAAVSEEVARARVRKMYVPGTEIELVGMQELGGGRDANCETIAMIADYGYSDYDIYGLPISFPTKNRKNKQAAVGTLIDHLNQE